MKREIVQLFYSVEAARTRDRAVQESQKDVERNLRKVAKGIWVPLKDLPEKFQHEYDVLRETGIDLEVALAMNVLEEDSVAFRNIQRAYNRV
jgi:hypothetical protein